MSVDFIFILILLFLVIVTIIVNLWSLLTLSLLISEAQYLLLQMLLYIFYQSLNNTSLIPHFFFWSSFWNYIAFHAYKFINFGKSIKLIIVIKIVYDTFYILNQKVAEYLVNN